MGLYINNGKHPDVFKNTEILHGHNQVIHRKDFLNEILDIQQQTNSTLTQSLDELNLHNQKQKEIISLQWKELHDQLNGLKKENQEHHQSESEMIEWLKNLVEKNKTIESFIENEIRLKQEIMNEMQIQTKESQDMTKQIEKYETLIQQLSQQIDKQTKQQEELTEKLALQENYQSEVLTRLDKQEALTEKLARQITHIRSILFERTNFLAEKIEDGYKLTSSYVYKLLTGSEQPLTFYTFKDKQENNQK